MTRLSRLTIRGFRSIRSLEDFELKNLTVLIGANASGKSNFISFFRMLSYATTGGRLQFYIKRYGGASSILFEGSERTPQIEASIDFDTEAGANEYAFRIFHAAGDTLIFADEKFRFSRSTYPGKATWFNLGAGHVESRLVDEANAGNKTAETILLLLKKCGVHQFHNTGEHAGLRQKHISSDNKYLREDAKNLAPILLELKQEKPKYYDRIVRSIRQLQPEFFDFELEAQSGSVYLQWYERTSPYVFGAHQASDGSLRAMALVTLLLLPEEQLPQIILLDEPELGLHPYAINIIAGLIKSVATTRQVVLATQSMTMLDYFEPADIVVVDRQDGASTFRRLDPRALKSWLEDYSMAELWEKNVIAGTP